MSYIEKKYVCSTCGAQYDYDDNYCHFCECEDTLIVNPFFDEQTSGLKSDKDIYLIDKKQFDEAIKITHEDAKINLARKDYKDYLDSERERFESVKSIYLNSLFRARYLNKKQIFLIVMLSLLSTFLTMYAFQKELLFEIIDFIIVNNQWFMIGFGIAGLFILGYFMTRVISNENRLFEYNVKTRTQKEKTFLKVMLFLILGLIFPFFWIFLFGWIIRRYKEKRKEARRYYER